MLIELFVGITQIVKCNIDVELIEKVIKIYYDPNFRNELLELN